jgi:hypothetical protein
VIMLLVLACFSAIYIVLERRGSED